MNLSTVAILQHCNNNTPATCIRCTCTCSRVLVCYTVCVHACDCANIKTTKYKHVSCISYILVGFS